MQTIRTRPANTKFPLSKRRLASFDVRHSHNKIIKMEQYNWIPILLGTLALIAGLCASIKHHRVLRVKRREIKRKQHEAYEKLKEETRQKLEGISLRVIIRTKGTLTKNLLESKIMGELIDADVRLFNVPDEIGNKIISDYELTAENFPTDSYLLIGFGSYEKYDSSFSLDLRLIYVGDSKAEIFWAYSVKFDSYMIDSVLSAFADEIVTYLVSHDQKRHLTQTEA